MQTSHIPAILSLRMKKLLLALCLAPSLSFAQSIAINGKEGYRKLTWDDYRGAPAKKSGLTAMTLCNITWQVNTALAKQDKDSFPSLKVSVSFGENSWVNRENEPTPAMLRHEQGHFDIAVVCAAELQRKFNDTTFGTFETAMPCITRMYQETLAKCDRMRSRYGITTSNSRNTKEQAAWDTYLDKEIARCLQAQTGN